VLAYYAIANASAWNLTAEEGRPPRALPGGGPAGRVVLAFALPAVSVPSGAGVLAAGAAWYGLRRAAIRR
jgi:basic amino acid/polyamine antiporter, APA family